MPGTEETLKPYLKWAGGKRQLLPQIRLHLPADFADRTYYEPFVGAGAVLFELHPTRAVINDFNSQLILTYRMIRDEVDALVAALREHQRQNSREYYYTIRQMDREPDAFHALPDVEKAARLIFMNKTCYNGLYRVNSQGLFNVPYGRYRNPAICEEGTLRAVSRYLRDNAVEICNGDFEQAVEGAGEDAFVYFDPPYHSPGNTNFTGYQPDGFTEADQRRLRDTAIRLTERGAKCLLSNSDTEFIRELYSAPCFHIHTVQAKRAINSNSAGRGDVTEVLIQNWQE
ncbi:DNA adenine methylase [Ruminococcaceae bacterium OttesenSCG-928-L11]|nr:DNA adenine methylase [Ruminococcaceae bacterium OttesenSCG-928-L11]